MCEVILVTLLCIRVKSLNIFVVSLFGVALRRRSLLTRPTAGCTKRPMLFVQLGGRLVLMKIGSSSFFTLLRLERGVACVLTTFHL